MVAVPPVNAREEILSRIRSALGDGGDAVSTPRHYRVGTDDPASVVVERFVERLADYRAAVHRVSEDDLPQAIAAALERRGARVIAVPSDLPANWLPEGIELLPDEGLSNDQLDRCEGVITGCALAIAETGTIVLDGGAQQGRRVLTLLPDYHLCIVREEQIVASVPQGIGGLQQAADEGRPITLISGPSATSDIELSRVEGVHGPRTLEALVVGSSTATVD